MKDTISLLDLINGSKCIGILVSEISSENTAFGISTIVQIIKDLKKEVHVISLQKVSQSIKHIFEEYGITIEKKISPSEYMVSIDYGKSGVEKVVYDTDKETGKLVFKIFPSKGSFDFSNVEFVSGGAHFDGAILIDIPAPKTLGKIYDENEYIFREIPNASISSQNADLCSQVSTELSSILSPLSSQILLRGLGDLNIFENSLEPETWEKVSQIVSSGINLAEIVKTKYYSKSLNYINLIIRVMQNVQTRRGDRVIWSKVSLEEIKSYNIDPLNISFTGKIPFNLSSEFDLAFILFQIAETEAMVVIESNNPEKYSAKTISGVFECKGVDTHARCKIEGSNFNDIQKRFFAVLTDLYGLMNVDENRKGEVEIVDNSAKRLTKARKNSKNKGLMSNN